MLSLRAFESGSRRECLPNLTAKPCCISCVSTAASRSRAAVSAVATGSWAPQSWSPSSARARGGRWPAHAACRSTALARPCPAAAAGGSVLDATGYVTARREATVSAQITGTLTQVLIEEGDHVKEGTGAGDGWTILRRALRWHRLRHNCTPAQSLLAQYQVQLAQSVRDYNRAEDLVSATSSPRRPWSRRARRWTARPRSVEGQRKQIDPRHGQPALRPGAA